MSAPMAVVCATFVLLEVFLWTPWQAMIILSFSREARSFVIRTSEFWIKIIYGTLCALLHIIQYHKSGVFILNKDVSKVPEWLIYIYFTVYVIQQMIFMVIVGGVDAIPKMKYKWKACFIGTGGFIFTLLAIYYQFMAPTEDDYTFELKATRSIVSCHALLANAYGMVSMFLWKQIIDILRNKDRCVSILYRPFLRWESPGNIPERSAVVVESAT